MSELYIGLMSGTSMDNIDAVLVDFQKKKPYLKRVLYVPFPASLRDTLLSLQHSQNININTLMDCDGQLGELYAEAVCQLADKQTLKKVRAIGSHGQTLWHRPPHTAGRYPNSWQIGDPNIIAERTGVCTVADFRRRDMAAGGQGAPLVTAFHQQLFQAKGERRAILNIGGIANVTILDGEKVVAAFDTGPGNALMDVWIEQNKGMPFDAAGEWAKTGHVQDDLLRVFLQDAYFLKKPPKSTGREYFNGGWLLQKLSAFSLLNAQDVQATLCELTVRSIQQALVSYHAERLIVCGGGFLNNNLLQRLKETFEGRVQCSDDFGVAFDALEAMAFSWLAKRRLEAMSGNIPATTGASKAVVLGAVYASR